MVLPTPNNANVSIMVAKLYVTKGNNMAMLVTNIDAATTLRLPQRAIRSPVGMENTKNHKNTADGSKFAIVLGRLKSAFT